MSQLRTGLVPETLALVPKIFIYKVFPKLQGIFCEQELWTSSFP
jgi:hypothetical protein